MLPLEAYIAKRKSEDNLNEFDLEKRNENARICVNYVFEYFNNYLDISAVDEKTVLKDIKLEKYRKTLEYYDTDIQDWLVSIYSEHNNQLNRHIKNMIEDVFYLLYDSDAEFRSLSYDIYSKITKKLPYMKEYSEMLFLFLKDHHKVVSIPKLYDEFPFICESLNEWLDETYQKYGVSIRNFCFEWVQRFLYKPDTWPKTHKIKNEDFGKSEYKKLGSLFCGYDYDYKQKANLFNIDSLYRSMPKKKFIKGRKQEFEVVMMYYWTHQIDGDDVYWDEYLNLVLPSIDIK
jgi:hypothetical protein